MNESRTVGIAMCVPTQSAALKLRHGAVSVFSRNERNDQISRMLWQKQHLVVLGCVAVDGGRIRIYLSGFRLCKTVGMSSETVG